MHINLKQGAFSIGPALSGTSFPNLFYDKSDEVEAYDRGGLFGEKTYSINNLPAVYSNLMSGPNNFRSIPMINRALFSSNKEVELQHIANRTRSAFRINGKTYYKKR